MKLFLFLAILVLTSTAPVWADAVQAKPNPSASPSAPASGMVHTVSVPLSRLNRPQITQEEWQEMSHASAQAMKAHPELRTKAQALAQRMRDFQAKLDAAMIHDNPDLAPFIARLENRGAIPGSMAPRPLSPPGTSTPIKAPAPGSGSK